MVGHNYVPYFSVTVQDSLYLTSGNNFCTLQYKIQSRVKQGLATQGKSPLSTEIPIKIPFK